MIWAAMVDSSLKNNITHFAVKSNKLEFFVRKHILLLARDMV